MTAVSEAQRAGAAAAAEQSVRVDAAEARAISVEAERQRLERLEALRVAQLQNAAQQFGGASTRLQELDARVVALEATVQDRDARIESIR
eukprot:3912523-Lingulodinium_polyedra.AAC.1